MSETNDNVILGVMLVCIGIAVAAGVFVLLWSKIEDKISMDILNKDVKEMGFQTLVAKVNMIDDMWEETRKERYKQDDIIKECEQLTKALLEETGGIDESLENIRKRYHDARAKKEKLDIREDVFLKERDIAVKKLLQYGDSVGGKIRWAMKRQGWSRKYYAEND